MKLSHESDCSSSPAYEILPGAARDENNCDTTRRRGNQAHLFLGGHCRLARRLRLAWTILHFGQGMVVHFDASQSPGISTDIRNIPYYAGRTVLRMWLAFGFSLLFTFSVGYAAAKSRIARAVILPALDILQSVPVLGFLSITVTGFMALFPGSLLGVECASIFAIFTGQVWNMTFGFYHSLVTIPNDLQEAATNFRFSRWQRFGTLEVPSSMHSLIWNSMMSFGGGWFFVAQSEAITVLEQEY